jgi:hypothetical protein
MVPPFDITALVSLADTVCLSVRSTSVKASVPEVGSLVGRLPPCVDVPAAKWTSCVPVVMTGLSLLPVIVMVTSTPWISGAGRKLLSTVMW